MVVVVVVVGGVGGGGWLGWADGQAGRWARRLVGDWSPVALWIAIQQAFGHCVILARIYKQRKRTATRPPAAT